MNRMYVLYLRSRRVPLAVLLMVVIAGVLGGVGPLTDSGSEFAVLLPLVLLVAVAAVIAASTRSPFGDPERATFPLPRLRLVHLMALVAIGVVLGGLARLGHDPAAGMRDVAGLTGLALLGTPLVGAALGWILPLAYVVYCGGPVDIHQVGLSAWPALSGDNFWAALIALTLLTAGVGTVTAVGAREHRTDPL